MQTKCHKQRGKRKDLYSYGLPAENAEAECVFLAL